MPYFLQEYTGQRSGLSDVDALQANFLYKTECAGNNYIKQSRLVEMMCLGVSTIFGTTLRLLLLFFPRHYKHFPLLLVSSYFHFFCGIHLLNPVFLKTYAYYLCYKMVALLKLLTFVPRAHVDVIPKLANYVHPIRISSEQLRSC